jgi:hypothetical protein
VSAIWRRALDAYPCTAKSIAPTITLVPTLVGEEIVRNEVSTPAWIGVDALVVTEYECRYAPYVLDAPLYTRLTVSVAVSTTPNPFTCVYPNVSLTTDTSAIATAELLTNATFTTMVEFQ